MLHAAAPCTPSPSPPPPLRRRAGGGPAGSAWPQALLLAFGVHLGWLQPLLTPAGYDALVHLVLDKVRGRGGNRKAVYMHCWRLDGTP